MVVNHLRHRIVIMTAAQFALILALAIVSGDAIGAPPAPATTANRALLMGAALGRVDIVEHALAQGANIETRDPSDDKFTALILATRAGHAQVVERLLAGGTDVNAHSTGGLTALMFAAHDDRIELVDRLLGHGADPHAYEERDGYTALHIATQRGNLRTLTYLLKHGADPNIPTSKDGRTPLMLAARQAGGLKAVVELIASGAEVNLAARDGYTALMGASVRGHAHITETLILNKADVNATSNNGTTGAALCTGPR
jgi:serine/threonine-protein phosphatase 6 regulatory ankyrin repeat subunit B